MRSGWKTIPAVHGNSMPCHTSERNRLGRHVDKAMVLRISLKRSIAPRRIILGEKNSGGVILSQQERFLAPSRRVGILASDHPHDGPRTLIRGRMAPRGSKPAGPFSRSQSVLECRRQRDRRGRRTALAGRDMAAMEVLT